MERRVVVAGTRDLRGALNAFRRRPDQRDRLGEIADEVVGEAEELRVATGSVYSFDARLIRGSKEGEPNVLEVSLPSGRR